jgi:hypothetical protein
MPGAEFYRRHAARCRVLAERHSRQHWAIGLVRLAEAYEAQALEVELRMDRRIPGENLAEPSASVHDRGLVIGRN